MTTDIFHHYALPHAEETHSEGLANAAFGFWIYIMSDCILFAALFATFVVLGGNYAGGPSGKTLFDLAYTLGETMCLLCSSISFGFATLAMQKGGKNAVVVSLVVTLLLGLAFVGMEVNEFHGLVAAGNGPERSGFLSGFFTLVATHGAHVTVGLVWIAIMMAQVWVKGLTARVRSRLMRLGLFWHFLDIVWIGVFTIVYLRGVII